MKETRDAAAVRVFPPGVPLLTIAMGIGLNRLWPLKPRIKPSRLARYVGATIVGAAILGLGLYPVISPAHRAE
jgi:hypothetical protein